MVIDVPVPFRGTEQQRLANRNSHYFDWQSGRCIECDCKQWHEAADYPCGADVPRMELIR